MRSEERNPERTVGNPEAMAKVLVNGLTAEVGTSPHLSDFATNQDLAKVIEQSRAGSLQLRVLGLGLLQHGDVAVRIFPDV